MNKIFSAFVIAVCCMFMAMPAQAQLLKWGVKGGVNMTKIDWDGGYKGNKDNSTGFFIGPMAEKRGSDGSFAQYESVVRTDGASL